VVDVPDQSDVDASLRDRRIFANYGGLFSPPGVVTRASGTEFEALESLLDRTRTDVIPFEDGTLTEIPFLDRYSCTEAIVTSQEESESSDDTLSVVKYSLLDWYHPETEEHELFVLTMIPYAEYQSAGENFGYSFLGGLEEFRGILIFSEPDGTFISSHEYLGGDNKKMYLLTPSDMEVLEEAGIVLNDVTDITFTVPGTKVCNKVKNPDEYTLEGVNEGGELTPAIVTANGPSSGPISNRGAVCLNGISNYVSYYRSYGNTGGYSKNNSKPQKGTGFDNLFKTVKERDAEIAIGKISELYQKVPELQTIIEEITGLDITLVIVPSLSGGALALTNPGRFARGNTWTRITFTVTITEDTPPEVLMHELFHVYQFNEDFKKRLEAQNYGSSYTYWQNGDIEAEAGIFDALMMKKYQLPYSDGGVLGSLRDPLIDYYNNPCEEYWKYVEQYLGERGYFSPQFKVSGEINHTNKIHHIQQIMSKTRTK